MLSIKELHAQNRTAFAIEVSERLHLTTVLVLLKYNTCSLLEDKQVDNNNITTTLRTGI